MASKKSGVGTTKAKARKKVVAPKAMNGGVDAFMASLDHPKKAEIEALRKIFLGEVQFWGDNSRIVLLVRAPVARERDIVLSKIYRMGEAEFQQYWIAKVFRAEVSSKPKIVYSSGMTSELVTALPGAIGFLPADEVGPGMKVLRINGKLPGEAGYPLQ